MMVLWSIQQKCWIFLILNIGILMRFCDYKSRVMSELIGKLSFIAVIMIGIINKRKTYRNSEKKRGRYWTDMGVLLNRINNRVGSP
ncbi:hypothetical protein ASG99_07770 [Bacillus sp. Soil768D1]|nr:hypothetical protein ASG99_07770 [Bacillus sp. Soil768D1]